MLTFVQLLSVIRLYLDIFLRVMSQKFAPKTQSTTSNVAEVHASFFSLLVLLDKSEATEPNLQPDVQHTDLLT